MNMIQYNSDRIYQRIWSILLLLGLMGIATGARAQSLWSTQVIDTADDAGEAISLQVDPTGKIHLSYNNETQSQLRYASISPGGVSPSAGWTVEILERGGGDTTLVVDSQNRPHIRYTDPVTIHFADWNGSAWLMSTFGAPGVWEYHLSAVIDPSDVISFTAYQRCVTGPAFCEVGQDYTAELYLFARDGKKGGIIDPPGGQSGVGKPEFGKWNSLSLDPTALGKYHMVYTMHYAFVSQQSLRYAVWDGVNPPVYETIEQDGVGQLALWAKIKVDSKGTPHVAYVGSGNNVKYAWRDSNGWHSYDVDAGGTGEGLALSIDSADHPHIAYFDRTNGQIKYATSSNPFAGAAGWTFESVATGVTESTGIINQFIWIALNKADVPIVAYHAASKSTSPTADADLLIAYRGMTDTDGDGIPDLYDPFPNDPDVNKNGTLDGAENTSALINRIPPPSGGGGSGGGTPSTSPPQTGNKNLVDGFFGCGMVNAINHPFRIGDVTEFILFLIWIVYRKVKCWFRGFIGWKECSER